MQEVVLAMLAKEPSHGYELRSRLRDALGLLGEEMNDGQVYVMLARLEKGGLVSSELSAGQATRSDRRMYTLTAAGQQRVAAWLGEVTWPKPDFAEFHLKLVAVAAAKLADPIVIVDAQRRELLRRLCTAQRAAMAEPANSIAGLLLEGVVLRLQADVRWAGSLRTGMDQASEAGVSSAASGDSVLRAFGLRFDYGQGAGLVRAVDGVDLLVTSGETVAVMGPSGCGKSTLLHLLGGLDRPTDGEVWLDGRQVEAMSERGLARLRRTAIGFVFQAFHLLDELTAMENIELPARSGGPGRSCRAPALGTVGRAASARRDRSSAEQRSTRRTR